MVTFASNISTLQALRWMLRHQLIVPGTLVRYDDWPGDLAAKGGEHGALWGQSLAHIQATRRFRVEWRRVSRNVFELVSTGRTAAPALEASSCHHAPCQ